MLESPSRAGEHHPSKIVLVSGLPRSGTSLMMSLLEAGGITLLVDHVRQADADNPQGYYEYERVKNLPEGDSDWLSKAQGKALKVISFFLKYLPTNYFYEVIFMDRELSEILLSQDKMLERRGEQQDQNQQDMAQIYKKHLVEVVDWMKTQQNIRHVMINYNQLIKSPLEECQKVIDFLGLDLDINVMTAKIDPDLYRQRR
jgi:hypothetical protein